MDVRWLVGLMAVKVETIRARPQHGWHGEFAFYSPPLTVVILIYFLHV
jgi:hypothetical protein